VYLRLVTYCWLLIPIVPAIANNNFASWSIFNQISPEHIPTKERVHPTSTGSAEFTKISKVHIIPFSKIHLIFELRVPIRGVIPNISVVSDMNNLIRCLVWFSIN